jgi:hypothetical protein
VFEQLDFDAFHAERVPELLALGHGRLAAGSVRGVGPVAFRLPDGRAYTFAAESGEIVVRPGDRTAATVVLLSEAVWSDFVWEARTARGLEEAGLLTFVRGDAEGLMRWEPALRAVFTGRPLYDPTRVAGVELGRVFRLHDPDRELAAFLGTAGFLHVRGALRADEADALGDEVEHLRDRVRSGDPSSGATVVGPTGEATAIAYASLVSARIAVLAEDGRLRRLAALAGTPLAPCIDRLGGVSAVVRHRHAGVASDREWRRVCDLGGHPLLCPSLEVIVHLDATEEGPYLVLAGSHESSGPPPGSVDERDLPVVALRAAPGDVTLRFGHLLHAPGFPPAGGDRRSLHVTFAGPRAFELIGPGQSYDDVLRRPRGTGGGGPGPP